MEPFSTWMDRASSVVSYFWRELGIKDVGVGCSMLVLPPSESADHSLRQGHLPATWAFNARAATKDGKVIEHLEGFVMEFVRWIQDHPERWELPVDITKLQEMSLADIANTFDWIEFGKGEPGSHPGLGYCSSLLRTILILHRDEGLVHASEMMLHLSKITFPQPAMAYVQQLSSPNAVENGCISLKLEPGHRLFGRGKADLADVLMHLRATPPSGKPDRLEAVNKNVRRFFPFEFCRIPLFPDSSDVSTTIGFRSATGTGHDNRKPQVLPLHMAPGSLVHALTLFYTLDALLSDTPKRQSAEGFDREHGLVGTVLLDEPASMWHPTSQTQLAQYLKSISLNEEEGGKKAAGSNYPRLTMLIITHSPYILDLSHSHAAVFRIARTHHPGRNPTSAIAGTLVSGVTELNVLQMRDNPSASLSLFRTLPGRSSLFAENVIVVEGASDLNFLQAFQRRFRTSSKWPWLFNLSIIPAWTKSELGPAAQAMMVIGVPYVCLADADMMDDGSRKKLPDRIKLKTLATETEVECFQRISVAPLSCGITPLTATR